MPEKQYVVLYTHQKTKKAKTWQDGFLKVSNEGTKATLFDTAKSKLDSLYTRADQIVVGEQLESDQYLITVEEESVGNQTNQNETEQHANLTQQSGTEHLNQQRGDKQHPATRVGGLRAIGLKRKRSGFIPPRIVKQPKHEAEQEEGPTEAARNEDTGKRLCSPPGLFSTTGKPLNIIDLYSNSKSSPQHSNYIPQATPQNKVVPDVEINDKLVDGKCTGQKRSTDQILALIGGKKSFKPPVRPDDSAVLRPQGFSKVSNRPMEYNCSDENSCSSQQHESNASASKYACSPPITNDKISHGQFSLNDYRPDPAGIVTVSSRQIKYKTSDDNRPDPAGIVTVSSQQIKYKTSDDNTSLTCGKKLKTFDNPLDVSHDTKENLVENVNVRNSENENVLQQSIDSGTLVRESMKNNISDPSAANNSISDLTDAILPANNILDLTSSNKLLGGGRYPILTQEHESYQGTEASFSISFSPLSHVSDSDEEESTEEMSKEIITENECLENKNEGYGHSEILTIESKEKSGNGDMQFAADLQVECDSIKKQISDTCQAKNENNEQWSSSLNNFETQTSSKDSESYYNAGLGVDKGIDERKDVIWKTEPESVQNRHSKSDLENKTEAVVKDESIASVHDDNSEHWSSSFDYFEQPVIENECFSSGSGKGSIGICCKRENIETESEQLSHSEMPDVTSTSVKSLEDARISDTQTTCDTFDSDSDDTDCVDMKQVPFQPRNLITNTNLNPDSVGNPYKHIQSELKSCEVTDKPLQNDKNSAHTTGLNTPVFSSEYKLPFPEIKTETFSPNYQSQPETDISIGITESPTQNQFETPMENVTGSPWHQMQNNTSPAGSLRSEKSDGVSSSSCSVDFPVRHLHVEETRPMSGHRQLINTQMLSTALTATLPHPSELTRRSKITVKREDHLVHKDIVSSVSARLDTYTVKGSVTGEGVKRDRHPVKDNRVWESDGFNTGSDMHLRNGRPAEEMGYADNFEEEFCQNDIPVGHAEESLYFYDVVGKEWIQPGLEVSKNYQPSPYQEVPESSSPHTVNFRNCQQVPGDSPLLGADAFYSPGNTLSFQPVNHGDLFKIRSQSSDELDIFNSPCDKFPIRDARYGHTNSETDRQIAQEAHHLQQSTKDRYLDSDFEMNTDMNGGLRPVVCSEYFANQTQKQSPSLFGSGNSNTKAKSKWALYENEDDEKNDSLYHGRFSPQQVHTVNSVIRGVFHDRTNYQTDEVNLETNKVPSFQQQAITHRKDLENMVESPFGNFSDEAFNSPSNENLPYISTKQNAEGEYQPVTPDLFSQTPRHSENIQSDACAEEERNNFKQNTNKTGIHKGFKPPQMSRVIPKCQRTPKSFQTPVCRVVSQQPDSKVNMCSDLKFLCKADVESSATPVRQVTIPVDFTNVAEYKQVLSLALKEHLNIILFELAKQYHSALTKVDTSNYSSWENVGHIQKSSSSSQSSGNPPCQHGTPSKIVQVKKDGPNKGRYFFACNAPRNQQCKYFQWADQVNQTSKKTSSLQQLQLSDASSLTTYFKGQRLSVYLECKLVRKAQDTFMSHMKKFPSWVRKNQHMSDQCSKKKLFIKLPRKEGSTMYQKYDIWIVSQGLQFDPQNTFIAKSVFYGPNSNNEVEIEPVSGYSPSNWANNSFCHALHAFNASSEFACLDNLQEHVKLHTLPVLPCLLERSEFLDDYKSTRSGVVDEQIFSESEHLISKYKLNDDQAEALRRISVMFQDSNINYPGVHLIHGVFGAGKSFLLAVVVLFLTKVFELRDQKDNTMKVLISSTTNVAVDRILQGLLSLGFEDFVRVGSVKKIAKPVLPYSVHATGTDNQELKELQEMLKGDITPSEKQYVRKSIEKQRLGENKKRLGRVRVVGVTCAACAFKCMDNMSFQVVLLDESSQMTEPASLLPIARFQCQKLVLVGDPKQLNPTLQGSEAAHQQGLEQTLFDRLMLMGYAPTLLRTQYRCHPTVSAIANNLFYGNQLRDGVTQEDRLPLAPSMPSLCFFDVKSGQEHVDSDGSYFNQEEASFVVFLIEHLVLAGVEPTEIGVITLYKSQMRMIMQTLQSSSIDHSELKTIQISTVDAFQGGEKGIIILSCVRTQYVGFIDCDKRTNVALTRSKNHLFIVGNQTNLSRNLLWGKVIQHCKDSPNGLQSAREFQSIFEHKGVAPSSSSGESNMGRTHNSQVRRQCKTPRLPQTLPINIHSDNMD